MSRHKSFRNLIKFQLGGKASANQSSLEAIIDWRENPTLINVNVYPGIQFFQGRECIVVHNRNDGAGIRINEGESAP